MECFDGGRVTRRDSEKRVTNGSYLFVLPFLRVPRRRPPKSPLWVPTSVSTSESLPLWRELVLSKLLLMPCSRARSLLDDRADTTAYDEALDDDLDFM